MAQVTQAVTEKVEHLLSYLFGVWGQDLPEMAAEWDGMDRYERNDFLLDWPVAESYTDLIAEYAEQDILTSAQRERYDALLALIAANRPILNKLMEGW